MSLPERMNEASFELTPEHDMLLRMRDTLYEGSWEDFRRDLQARLNGEPYVFEIVPASPEMRSTIESHLRFIGEMETWERARRRPLRPLDTPGDG
jgi:hypothetical protein